jgi:hypothetical protein
MKYREKSKGFVGGDGADVVLLGQVAAWGGW